MRDPYAESPHGGAPAIRPRPCPRCDRRTTAKDGRYCIVCADWRERMTRRGLPFILQRRLRDAPEDVPLDHFHEAD